MQILYRKSFRKRVLFHVNFEIFKCTMFDSLQVILGLNAPIENRRFSFLILWHCETSLSVFFPLPFLSPYPARRDPTPPPLCGWPLCFAFHGFIMMVDGGLSWLPPIFMRSPFVYNPHSTAISRHLPSGWKGLSFPVVPARGFLTSIICTPPFSSLVTRHHCRWSVGGVFFHKFAFFEYFFANKIIFPPWY